MAMRAVISRRLANPGWDALAARSGIRRGFSGKVLGEEERAAENIYIKKMEQEKLEKLVQQGLSAEEAKAAVAASATATPEATKVAKAATAPKVSTDSNMNYAVIAGIVGVAGIAYWYFSSPSKKETDNKE